MEDIYYWIGLVVFWYIFGVITVWLIGTLVALLINILGKKYKKLWVIVEYARNRQEFKEWTKYKKKVKNKINMN